MESIATGVSNLLAALNADAAKELRIAQNNQRFKNAVIRTWSENPDVAAYLLAHVNALYVAKDKAPRKGRGKDKDPVVLGVYLDNSHARSEINARRELLKLALAQEGMHVDEVRDHPAMYDMKDRHLYPDAVERMANLSGQTPSDDPFCRRAKPAEGSRAGADQSDLLEILKRAFCLSFPDIEHAWAVLEKVEGAALTEARFNKNASHSAQRYRCHLYVDAAHLEGVRKIIARFGDTVASRAKRLRLLICEICVHPSPEALHGRQAFPRSGRPEPLGDLDLQELRSESARVAAEVRAKVRGRARSSS